MEPQTLEVLPPAPGTPNPQTPALLQNATPPQKEIVVWDTSHPYALITMLPPVVQEKLKDAAKEKPILFGMDERTLYKFLRDSQQMPSPTDNRLRLKFWLEFDRAVGAGERKMTMANVMANVCTREFFYDHYLSNPGKVAWLLNSPSDYTTKAEEALDFGLDQLRDILEVPHMVGDRVDMKIASLKVKVVAMLNDRVRGAVVQKVVNLNASTTDVGTVNKVALAMTESDLDKRLNELERRNRRALHLPEGAK